MDTATFDGIEYPVRLVYIDEYGLVYIGVESMENVLIKDGNFVNLEAFVLDSQILFYVPDEIIEDEGKVMSYLNRHLS